MGAFILAVWAFITVYYVPVLGLYALGGILYAVLKWILKTVILRSEVANLVASKEGGSIETQRLFLVRKIYGRSSVGGPSYPPQVKQYKGKFFAWALFWPVNLVWTMFADVARNVWLWVYNTFGAMLQRLSDSILPK